jgi:nitroalkane oxidase
MKLCHRATASHGLTIRFHDREIAEKHKSHIQGLAFLSIAKSTSPSTSGPDTKMIDFTISSAQQALRSQAASFASNVLSQAPSTYSKFARQDERFQSLKPIYEQAVAGGLIKGMIPQPLGGTGGSLVDATLLVEELYAADTSASLVIFATGLGLHPLMNGGSAEQRREFLKPFLSSDGAPLASLVCSEPSGSANWLEKGAKGLQTVAWQEGDGEWVIDGEKVCNALQCHARK